ncbi:hypothetical protein SAMN05892877_12942 [Rhizobium subbaraonis]|uniref:Uncharacterized protein n=1 Tax=Rhizobium subbaraonis TaxID=908946 RepID=A0A285V012_9HYPH|nr:hypothetical protein SAMN05892877_12942 [Rhizobium subbaraonis]
MNLGGRLDLELDRRTVVLPLPCRRLSVSLMNLGGQNVAKLPSQFDQERLERKREDACMRDLLPFDPAPDLFGKLPLEVALLNLPILFVSIIERKTKHLQIDSVEGRRRAIRLHGSENVLPCNERLIYADIRAETDYMRCPVRLNTSCDTHPPLMVVLHPQEKFLRMIIGCFVIDETMVFRAEQHEI